MHQYTNSKIMPDSTAKLVTQLALRSDVAGLIFNLWRDYRVNKRYITLDVCCSKSGLHSSLVKEFFRDLEDIGVGRVGRKSKNLKSRIIFNYSLPHILIATLDAKKINSIKLHQIECVVIHKSVLVSTSGVAL